MGEQASIIIRELVLKLHNEGKTFSEIGSITNRSHNTVKKVIDKYDQFGTINKKYHRKFHLHQILA